MKINVFKILKKTKVEGPGVRFCIWVQGCLRQCEGCFAKATWSHKPNKVMTVNELFNMIKEQEGIEGVTFLGGEPFEQADALSLLAKKVHDIGLSVVTFTGAKLEDLQSVNDDGFNNLIKYSDILIDGEFVQEKFELSRPWVGSSNQRYIFLSDRYSLQDVVSAKNKVEVRINKNGMVFVNGMADFKVLKKDIGDLCLPKGRKRI